MAEDVVDDLDNARREHQVHDEYEGNDRVGREAVKT